MRSILSLLLALLLLPFLPAVVAVVWMLAAMAVQGVTRSTTEFVAFIREYYWGIFWLCFFLLFLPACVVHLLNTWLAMRRAPRIARELGLTVPAPHTSSPAGPPPRS